MTKENSPRTAEGLSGEKDKGGVKKVCYIVFS